MKKQTVKNNKDAYVYRLAANYSKYVLAPSCALESLWKWKYRTLDDKVVTIDPIASWMHSEGSNGRDLDFICRKYWNTPFQEIKSLWHTRLGHIDDCWHLFRLDLYSGSAQEEGGGGK